MCLMWQILDNFIVEKKRVIIRNGCHQSTKRASARSKCIILQQDLSVRANLSIFIEKIVFFKPKMRAILKIAAILIS